LEFSRKKINKSICKNLIFGFVFFLFAISLFSPIFSNPAYAQLDGMEGSNTAQLPAETIAMPVKTTADVSKNDSSCSFLKSGVKCFILPFFKLNGIILEMALSLFDIMINPGNVQKVLGNPAIYSAWAFVRDFLNMAFILVLLFSAFCTIFQIEQYNYKKVLWKIVLMALLVNFSFPITRFIIDSSNILMYSLLKTNIFATATPVDMNSGLAKISQFGDLDKLMLFDERSDTASLLATTVMFFMLAMTFLAIGVLLMIRLIALAIIIIFSPIAFTGSIIPGISAQASKWWDNLIKYSFFGPIMIFGIVLCVGLMQNMGSALQSTKSEGNFIGTLLAVSVPIVLLWMVMGVAQSMSIAGAGAVMGAAQGAIKWAGKAPGKAAWWGIKKGAKKFERDVLASRGLSPRAFVEGWKQRTQEAEDKALKPAAGRWRDKMNKFFKGEETNHEDAALQSNISKEQKELSDVSQESEFLLKQFRSTEASSDSRKSQKMAAILRIMFNNNDQNEFMKGFNESVEPEHMKQFIYNKLVAAGMTEEQAAKQMMDYSEIAESKGNYGNYAMGIYDKDANNGKGIFRLSKPDEQRAFSVAKGTNVESQIKMRNWHWNAFLTENADSTTGNLHEMGKAMLSSLTQSEVGQMSRARKDFLNKLYEKKDQIEQHAKYLEGAGNKDQAETVRAFVREIEKHKLSKPPENLKPKKPAGFGR
jgi:hypothetical protein